ncbi:MAG TPA: dCTP deaminase [Lacipirellulaceae bacterium]|jgi:dCTP deaminase
MILCNRELHTALDARRIIITPEPQPRQPLVAGGHCPFDTHSVDLRLSDEISVPKAGGLTTIDLTRPGNVAQHLQNNSESLRLSDAQPYLLQANQFILGKTLERVELPWDPECEVCLAARIEGKSSRARFGLLIHFTAPTVHPGFRGTLTLEMINLGPWPLLLRPGLPIAQLIVEEVRGCPYPNPSQFQGQTSAAGLAGNAQA